MTDKQTRLNWNI